MTPSPGTKEPTKVENERLDSRRQERHAYLKIPVKLARYFIRVFVRRGGSRISETENLCIGQDALARHC